MPIGRPSLYSDELVDKICERIALGESLLSICTDDDMPSQRAIYDWLAEDRSGFVQKYTRAREMQADYYAAEIVKIADNPVIGVTTKTTDDGKTERIEGDMIQHRRLQVDARKWYASKLAPKKYGDKTETTLRGDPDNPVVVTNLSAETQGFLEQMRAGSGNPCSAPPVQD